MRQLVYKLTMVFIFTVLLTFNLHPAVIYGQEYTKPQDMARFYPSSTLGFSSFRIDKTSIDQLDRIMKLILKPLSGQVPQLSFRDAILASTGQNVDEWLSWLGDYGSVGILPSTNSSSVVGFSLNDARAVINLKDVETARAFLRTKLSHYTERALNDYTLFSDTNSNYSNSATIELIGNQMVISAVKTGIGEFPSSPTLQDNAAFQQAVNSLPASDYGVIMYLGQNWASQIAYGFTSDPSFLERRFDELGIDPNVANAAPFAIGLTVLDGNTLTIDTAQLPKSEILHPQRVDPNFMRFIPSDVDAVVQATNLTALYQNTAATINDIASRNPSLGGSQRNLVSEFETLISQFGIDIQNDLLSWTTGDYALFARADILPIAEAAVQSRIDANDKFDFGLVIQATNPVAAQSFADRLGRTLLRTAPPSVAIVGDQVNGINVTKITANVPMNNGDILTVELLMGISGDVFFLATPRMVQSITAKASSLADLPAYQDTSRYFLPQPTSVWYTNGKGLIIGSVMNPVSAIVGLALLGPSIGNVFGQLCDNQGTCVPMPTPTPTPTPDPSIVLEPLQMVINEIHAATASSTVTNTGVTLNRLTLTVADGQ